MDEMESQVRYSSDAGRGYIYFNERSKNNIRYTGDLELEEAHEFLLDFDKKWNIVGIELEGVAAQRIRKIAGQSHVFQKKVNTDGQVYYVLRLTNEKIRTTIFHPKAKDIHFHFADVPCQDYVGIRDFIGIDILDNDFYSEQYLVGD
ncbi:hypothetical protein ACIQZG_09030 [Lysinibacillus sp. NPDC096418]|uniref:hypothetical protein n=1 Tax=Lysinibacillus sp. NPDC096418 TaxID=3364138 RepID=UPI00382B3CAC